MRNEMEDKYKHIFLACALLLIVAFTTMGFVLMSRQAVAEQQEATLSDSVQAQQVKDSLLAVRRDSIARARALVLASMSDSIRGTLTDTLGMPMAGVVVSDSYTCTVTDTAGHYALLRNMSARFVYYTVPAYCEVPTHSASDNTACFYRRVSGRDSVYDFTLTRLPNGKETVYRMIVIGDPQITNAINPYYEDASDNPIKKSDVARFTDETMADIRQTIDSLPEGMPVYGLSMGDDVQYHGGYNATLEGQIRAALGSSKMRLFSVIGNHDQDGKKAYKERWEESWGPTDYSFDRGDVHYVCFNNCSFYHGSLYYQPGELTDEQLEWLRQDLSLVDSTKKVVLSYHIPLTFGNRPGDKATPLGIATEKGHYASSRLSAILRLLNRFEGGYELFCGHTHFALNHEVEHDGLHVLEHCHAAACGNIWNSNINICGTPNGYYVYTFEGTRLSDCYYKGTRWDAREQMTLFRADTKFNGESYAADWSTAKDSAVIVANVFNADSRWTLTAVEGGVEYPMTRLSGLGQDAFATGYHHRYCKSVSYWFVSKQNTYLIMNHLYYYVPKNPKAIVFVKAVDPYGNVYVGCSTEIQQEPYMNYAHYYR